MDQGTFNSADTTEYSDTIKVHAISYINKLDSKIGKHLSTIKLPKQVCTDTQLRSMTTERNVLLDHELRKLKLKYGFKYCAATGMILFAYVLCRLDIGFLIIILSKYNHQPNEIHFEVAAQVLLYLITTKEKGINYHRIDTKHNLLPCPDLRPSEHHEEPFPISTPSLQLAGTVDASFAPDIEQHKSITGYTFFLA